MMTQDRVVTMAVPRKSRVAEATRRRKVEQVVTLAHTTRRSKVREKDIHRSNRLTSRVDKVEASNKKTANLEKTGHQREEAIASRDHLRIPLLREAAATRRCME